MSLPLEMQVQNRVGPQMGEVIGLGLISPLIGMWLSASRHYARISELKVAVR
jgi:hypothetical protein